MSRGQARFAIGLLAFASGIGLVAGAVGCEIFSVDALHWLLGYNFYAVAEGKAYRSRQPDTLLLDYVVGTLGVRTVINLRGENPGQPWYDEEAARVKKLGARLVSIPMSAAEPPSPEVLLELYDAFLTVEYPILIHCQAGSDRAGAASAIWRMTVNGDSRKAALGELDPKYGHLSEFTPAMDWLAEVFVPDANWISSRYDPNVFTSSDQRSALSFQP